MISALSRWEKVAEGRGEGENARSSFVKRRLFHCFLLSAYIMNFSFLDAPLRVCYKSKFSQNSVNIMLLLS